MLKFQGIRTQLTKVFQTVLPVLTVFLTKQLQVMFQAAFFLDDRDEVGITDVLSGQISLEFTNQTGKTCKGRGSPGKFRVTAALFHDFKSGFARFSRQIFDSLKADLTDTAPRTVDRSQQSQAILRGGNNTQPGQGIANFFSIIKAQTAVNLIRHPEFPQGKFHIARKRVDPVENGHILALQRMRLAAHQAKDFTGHPAGFIVLVARCIKANFFSSSRRRPEPFLLTSLIAADNRIGGL